MARGKKAFFLGVAGAAALVFLAVLHVADPSWETCAGEANRLFNVAAAWWACGALFAAAAAMGRGARAPWAFLAVGLGLLAFSETVAAYFLVVRDSAISQLWLLNFAYLGAYALTIAALAWRAGTLPFTVSPFVKPVLIFLLTAVFAFFFYHVVRLVGSSRAMPGVIKIMVLLFPAADYVILVLAAYVFASYGRGVAGRPWTVVALGVLFIALSDLLGGFGAATAGGRKVYGELGLLAQFVGYFALAWGAWYQRALLKDAA